MPTERVFGPCPKCRNEAVDVRFHDGKPHCPNCRRDGIVPPSCRYSDVCGEKGRKGGHLTVACARCHYSWIEEPSPDA